MSTQTEKLAAAKEKAAAVVKSKARTPRAPKADKPLVRGFRLDADEYVAHPKTKRAEDGKLVPHIAAPSRREMTAKAKAGDLGVNRAYRVLKPLSEGEAKPGTWRHHRLSTILAATSKHEAVALYAKRPWPDNRPLDAYCFNWAVKRKYIAWID